MIPQANEDFENNNAGGPRLNPTAFDDDGSRLTPTAIDLVSPFDSSMMPHERSIEMSVNPVIPVDPPTTIVQRTSLQELPSGTIVGENYKIDARLGAGAMGEIYAARHMKLDKRVAIKIIVQRLSKDDEASARFVTEARTLAQIQHPSIVTVEHIGKLPDGRAYFVMEYLRGESLSERLARGRVPFRKALRILDQIARGLEAAHSSGIIHRDLKPDNTFLVYFAGEEPAVKLLDFGLAKLVATSNEISQHPERSESGVVIGTPLYMSPEQAHGPDVDHRTDIYALGCVAYELMLGVRPFPQARTTPEIYAAHLHGRPLLPRSIWPEIPPQLDRMLFTMLAKDPTRRPTLTQIRSVVTSLCTSTPSQQVATVPTWSRALKKRPQWTTILAFMIGALVTGAAFGAAIGTKIQSSSIAIMRRSRWSTASRWQAT